MGEVLGEAHRAATIGGAWTSTLLDATLAAAGEPAFRARQVWSWAARGATGYEQMTDLPAALRARLADARAVLDASSRCARRTPPTARSRRCSTPPTAAPVEAVLMRYRDGRRSVCVSSQSGCPLTCTFCATGSMKFGRNLTASEILDQVLHFRRIEPVDHLVFMGMGEPMMNLDHVLAAARAAARRRHHAPPHDACRRSAGCRASSGSTESDMPIRLALLAARARRRAALADHAGQRPLPARARCSRRARPTTRAAGARCSSST